MELPEPRRATSAVPILRGLLPFDRSRLPGDVLAGITLAALGIPEVMGYTKISGTPVVTGLYTMLLPVIVFALLGGSRHLVVAADSATAAILASMLVLVATLGTPEYVGLTSLVALIVAGMLVLLAAPGILVYRFEANLFYANADLFMEQCLALISAGKEPVRVLVLDASSIDDVDYTAAKMLLQLRTELAKRGVEVAVVTPHESMLQELGRYGLGTDRGRIYPTVDAAMAALAVPRDTRNA
jgi:MFS superfamily sulfate permease-like transporter